MACPTTTDSRLACLLSCLPIGDQWAVLLRLYLLRLGTDLDPAVLAANARCIESCVPIGMQLAVLLYLEQQIAGSTATPQQLIDAAGCESAAQSPGTELPSLIAYVQGQLGNTDTASELAADTRCLLSCLSEGMILPAIIYVAQLMAGNTQSASELATAASSIVILLPFSYYLPAIRSIVVVTPVTPIVVNENALNAEERVLAAGGQLTRDFTVFESLFISLGTTYDQFIALWTAYAVTRDAAPPNGATKLFDLVPPAVKVDGNWDLAWAPRSGVGANPSSDNITTADVEFGSKPSVRCTVASNDYYRRIAGITAIAQPFEFFAVFRPIPSFPTGTPQFRFLFDSDAASRMHSAYDQNAPGLYIYAGTAVNSLQSVVGMADGTFLLDGIVNGAGSSLAVHTPLGPYSTVFGATPGVNALAGGNKFYFAFTGSTAGFTPADFDSGRIAFLGFTNPLSAGDRTTIIKAMYDHYGAGSAATPVAATPDTVSGLKVWIDASVLVGVDGSTVSSWSDLSGNANDFGTVVGTPILRYASQNGLRGVEFAAGAGLAGTYARAAGQPFTIVAVLKSNSASATGRRALNGTNNWLVGPYNGFWQAYNGAFLNTAEVVNATSAHIVTVTQQTAGETIQMNSGLLKANNPATWPGTVGLGRNLFAEDFLGLFYEVAIYDRILTTQELADVRAGLKAKWATV